MLQAISKFGTKPSEEEEKELQFSQHYFCILDGIDIKALTS
jgi:hypothetical protein